jgi:beta-lactamase class A
MSLSEWVSERAGRAQAASSGHFGCRVIDLVSGEEAGFNDEAVRPAASVVKVPILIELYARKDLSLDERVPLRAPDVVGGAGVLLELHEGIELTLRDLGRLMIVVSDNTASNMLIDRLGMDAINARMRSIGMASSVLGRKFMIDPHALHAKNFTTARDMAVCLGRLQKGELLDEEATAEVIAVLKRQQYREKIPLLLPETVEVAHKTGEISHTRHDVGIVLARRPYVLSCLTWDLDDVLLGDRAIAEFSRALFDRMEASP